MLPLNYNFIVPCVHAWYHEKSIIIPVTCFCGPHFLMAWNIHSLCNLPCDTCAIVRHGIPTCVTSYMQHS